MRSPTALRSTGWSLVVCFVGVLPFFWLWMLNIGAEAVLDFGNRFTPIASAASGVTFAVVGWLIISRRHGNAVGWLALVIGSVLILSVTATEYAIYGSITRPDSLPAWALAGWLGNSVWVVEVALLGTVIVLLFPDGRLISAGWKWVMLAASVGMVSAATYFAFTPGPLESLPWIDNPLGSSSAHGWIEYFSIGFFLLMVTVPLAALSMRLRYLRAPVHVRAQIKWFAASAALITILYVGQFAYSAATGTLNGGSDAQRWLQTAAVAAFGTMAVAIGVAVLRYRLYEIDRIISRTLSYALMVGLLGLIVGALIAGLAVFVPSDDPLVVAAATLAVFALFNPIRRRVQVLVDRRFNRSRYDTVRVVDTFGASLQARVDPESLVDDWVEVVEDTMQPAWLGVWVR